MKCTNRKVKIGLISVFTAICLSGCGHQDALDVYMDTYNTNIVELDLLAGTLATPVDGVKLENFTESENINATALIDVTNGEIIQSKNLFESIAPASTTKIMTAYLALKYGKLDDMVTISENAFDLPSDAHMCGFKVGDTISLRNLLYGLTLYSGNDAALAIAEYISGSVSEFVTLMNKEAKELGATSTNFLNPHGLDSKNHMTTVYDLYLIFNAVVQNELYVEMINTTRYTTMVKDSLGEERQLEWVPTNYYHSGRVKSPEGINVIGGVTGTTGNAKNCLVLLAEDELDNRFISISMGSTTKDGLYEKLNEMLITIPIKNEEIVEEVIELEE